VSFRSHGKAALKDGWPSGPCYQESIGSKLRTPLASFLGSNFTFGWKRRPE
jgi:hypothetical protein